MTDAEIVQVAKIAQETFATVSDLVADLNAQVETELLAQVARWAPVEDKFVTLDGGGKYKINKDDERKRQAVREIVRKLLGLSLYSDESFGPGSRVLEHTAVW